MQVGASDFTPVESLPQPAREHFHGKHFIVSLRVRSPSCETALALPADISFGSQSVPRFGKIRGSYSAARGAFRFEPSRSLASDNRFEELGIPCPNSFGIWRGDF